jgi:maltose O-acetyltransferase
MMINAQSKRVIPFRPHDAKRVGKGCYYLDLIVWLNGEFIELGEEVGFNYGCSVNGFGGLTVGDRTMFGPYSMIHTANHETDPSKPLQEQGHIKAPVTIGKEVWIAMGVMILPGVTIGDGVIVGAGSVVTKDLPPYTLAVGNPCKVIKQRK